MKNKPETLITIMVNGTEEPITDRQIELLAHARGWPDPRSIRARKGVMRREWMDRLTRPYRNHFCASGSNLPEWADLVRLGLARRIPVEHLSVTYPTYAVTEEGDRITRKALLQVRAHVKASAVRGKVSA